MEDKAGAQDLTRAGGSNLDPVGEPPRPDLAGSGRPSGMRFLARAAVWLVPAVLAFSLGCWQISERSFTEDEAATMTAARQPLGTLLRTLLHVDAVHGVYYLLIHCMLSFGGSEAVARLPSAAASAVAAGALAALGARLAGGPAGFAAGLIYAVSPAAVAGAQFARPFELATALAVVACLRLVIFMQAGGRRNAAAYAAALALTGWVDILALLVVAANAVTVAWVPQWRLRFRGFAFAACAAGLAVLPLAVVAVSQIGQVTGKAPGPALALGVLGLCAGCGLLAAAVARPGRNGPAPSGPRALAVVAGPWLVLPPAILIAASQLHPIWAARYLWFCLPAAALLVVAALSRLPAGWRAPVTALVVAAALAAQPLARPAQSADDVRAVARLLAADARPGDAVVFQDPGRRLIKGAYPSGFAHLRDIALDNSPALRRSWFGHDAGWLHGWQVSNAVLYRRLGSVPRVWFIRYATRYPPAFYGVWPASREFCAVRTWQFAGATVTLYRRCVAAIPRSRNYAARHDLALLLAHFQRECRTGRLKPEYAGGQIPELSRFAVMEHLAVLVDAGVVLIERRGRADREAKNHRDRKHAMPLDCCPKGARSAHLTSPLPVAPSWSACRSRMVRVQQVRQFGHERGQPDQREDAAGKRANREPEQGYDHSEHSPGPDCGQPGHPQDAAEQQQRRDAQDNQPHPFPADGEPCNRVASRSR